MSGSAKGGSEAAYSITSSARVSSVGGTMMPSAFAVFRLIASSNLIGCSTGRMTMAADHRPARHLVEAPPR